MLPMDQPPPRTRERRPPEKGLKLVIFENKDGSSWAELLPDTAFWAFSRRVALLPTAFWALLPTD